MLNICKSIKKAFKTHLNAFFLLHLTKYKFKKISTMKKLSHFLFLMFSFFLFGIGLQEAKAVQCNDLAFASGSSSGTIVEIGGVYYYSITIANSGSPFISDVDIKMSIHLVKFTLKYLIYMVKKYIVI